jgi:hypothetical protein
LPQPGTFLDFVAHSSSISDIEICSDDQLLRI